KNRPKGFEPKPPTQVAVLGAGLMGSGIAHACVTRGLPTLLLDTTDEAAERGKAGVQKML
ncbi:MAG TPA: hypothetical protein DCF45_12175, partial [Gammaproteobacteria bacterium]|nr:hypothetical protein [Gammaproteobacteria bacterium]